MNDLKAKDIFQMLEVHELCVKVLNDTGDIQQFLFKDLKGIHDALLTWLHHNYFKLMPQEVITTLSI